MLKKILKMTWFDWRKSWRDIMPLAILYHFITVLIFIPVLGFLLNYFIAGSSPLNLFNEFVFQRILWVSPIVIVFIFIFFVLLFIEQYCWMFLSYQNRHGADFHLFQALKMFGKHFKTLWPLAIMQTGLNFLVAFFISSYLVTSPILSRFRFPSFISEFIEQREWFIILYLILAFILFWAYMRTVFLPAIAIDTRGSLREVFRQEKQLVKGHMLYQTALFIIAQAVILLAVLATGVVVYLLIVEGVLLIPQITSLQALAIANGLIVVLTTVFGAILSPIQALLIQNFYAVTKVTKGTAYTFEVNRVSQRWQRLSLWLIAFVSVIMFAIFTVTTDQTQVRQPLVIAHRGAGDQPQNTVASIQKALVQEAQMIEIDVQLTKDNVVILEHDQTFSRAFGLNGNVGDYTFAELQSLDAGAYFFQEQTTEKIATLAEIIAITEATKTPLIIELKSYSANPNRLVEAVAELIQTQNCEQRCIVASTKYAELAYTKTLNANLLRIYIAYLAFGDFSDLDVDGFMIETTNLTKKAVQRVQAKQKAIFAWTLNTENEIRDAQQKGVDGIITDNVPLVWQTYNLEAQQEE
ncbi:MAG: glycerophosphodiester phosphodiesterase family protein [Culicoidibacterales bacterium]